MAQLAYAWGWPMVNIQSRRLMYAQVPMKGSLGPMPVAPLTELALLADPVNPRIRVAAHPNQDVVFGFGIMALDQEPVVVQLPDFDDRLWMDVPCFEIRRRHAIGGLEEASGPADAQDPGEIGGRRR